MTKGLCECGPVSPLCNRCGSPMVPDSSALVPALGCINCGRLIPRTMARSVKGDPRAVKRAMRAARRQKLARDS